MHVEPIRAGRVVDVVVQIRVSDDGPDGVFEIEGNIVSKNQTGVTWAAIQGLRG